MALFGRPEKVNTVPIKHWFSPSSIVAIPDALSLRKFLEVFEETLNKLTVFAPIISASLN
jgi:hypothetical protein